MREAQQLVHINTMTLPAPKPEFISRTLRAAWLAILLGCFVEALLVLAASFGEVQSIKPFVAELTQKISWSVIVCAALACGTAANRMRAGVMGIVGMLSGPIAFHVARSFHKGVAQALAVTATPVADVLPLVLGAIEGIEYGILGFAVGWIGKRAWGGALAHAVVGLCVGLSFGGLVIALKLRAAASPPALSVLLAQCISGVIFPVGCALVLFASESLGTRAVRQQYQNAEAD